MDQKLLILLKWHIPYVPDTRGPTSRGAFGTFPSETFDTSRPGGRDHFTKIMDKYEFTGLRSN